RISREREDVAGAPDFVERILLADAALGRDQVGELGRACTNQRRRAVADFRALVTRELRAVALRDRQRTTDLIDSSFGTRAHDRARVRLADRDRAATFDPFTRAAARLAPQSRGWHRGGGR